MKYIFLFLLFASSDAFAFGAKIPTASGNYCKDEANEWLENRFGAEGKALSLTKAGSPFLR
jgi:hypothetical protein